MSNLKYKLEALLFSSARSMTLEELSNLTKASPEEIREKIKEIMKDYEERDSSITLIDEGNSFKLNIKSEHAPIVHQIVTETELSKTLMETLAIIAFKYPIKQSDLIKMRTNKAYDHLRELEGLGYIIRQKYSRTKLIKLTPKFFEYFDLPQDKLKEKFQGFEGIAKAISEKEQEIKKMKDEMKEKAKEAGKKGKEDEQEIDLIDKEGHKQKLEVYEETKTELEEQEAKEVKPYTDKIGNLEVTDIPEKEETLEEEEPTEEVEEPEETTEEETEETEGEGEVKGIRMTEEMGKNVVDQVEKLVKSGGEENKPKTAGQVEREVNERVEEMMHPKEETQQETAEKPSEAPSKEEKSEEESEPKSKEEQKIKDFPTSEPKDSEEPKDLLEAAAEEEEEQKIKDFPTSSSDEDEEKKEQKR